MHLYFRKLGTGKPIVILHGLFGSSDNWLTVSKAFSEKYEVFLIDLRNHGQSPHTESHTYEEMAEDLVQFLVQNNLEKIILIGHSMGGKTAMAFAQKYPQKIEKLIIVDISPRYYPPHHQRELDALHSLDLSKLQNRQEADEIMAKSIPELGVRQFLLKNLYRTEDGIFKWRMNLPVLTTQINRIGEESLKNSSISVPTLFLRGENSNYISENDIKLIQTIFTNAQTTTILNAGHWIQAEQPKAFQDVVFNFLA
ncbi:MAG: alpha/beta fold hydrolase [Bacteroidetes bacterium]|nr:MAG: alpha/beta fold hydrolase [Bacteroidota bacterium]